MSFAGNYYRWILRYFQPFVGSQILEVGAGSGNFSDFLLEFNPGQLVCLEPSENMFPMLQRRLQVLPNVHTRQSYLSEVCSDMEGCFDTVVYVNVLEHVPDDLAEVRLALGALKHGGHLLVFVPALPWLFGSADKHFGHYRRYTRESLQGLFSGLEVEVRACRYFDILGTLPWWVSFVLLRLQTMRPGVVNLYDRFVVPIASRMESRFAPPFGKNLLLAVRKR